MPLFDTLSFLIYVRRTFIIVMIIKNYFYMTFLFLLSQITITSSFTVMLLAVILILIFALLFLIRKHKKQNRTLKQLEYDNLILEQKVKIKEDEIKSYIVDHRVQSTIKEELLNKLQYTLQKDDVYTIKRILQDLIAQFRLSVYKKAS